ncbi:hypothetical protein PanWU01x14_194650 [Parasponia andersonii]|uniref:Uncharacterized protein n=1 Tax=Parasponia andersonii TaxID=3476 RepID=A0A2P5C0G4_PARAD|nr:hypothetical protein PanWU01x14_194650 [Parasponia andersonii]
MQLECRLQMLPALFVSHVVNLHVLAPVAAVVAETHGI